MLIGNRVRYIDMHQYYSLTNANGELQETRVHIPWDELIHLLVPGIAPDGFKVESWENGMSGVDFHFVRADPTTADKP